jgi:FkbM family methyltransferase
MNRRLALRTRLGPVLETEIGNAWPIVEVFRDGCYAAPIDWESARLIVDVGGHVGAFTCWAAWRAPRARIVVFEPEPRNFRDLESNVERNRLLDRTTLVPAAVGSFDGSQRLGIPIHRYKAGFLEVNAPALAVECISLDRYLRCECPEGVDLLKFDAEGAEWEVLPSLGPEAWRRVKQVLVEFHAHERSELIALMEPLTQAGFVARAITAGAGDADWPVAMTLWAARPGEPAARSERGAGSGAALRRR